MIINVFVSGKNCHLFCVYQNKEKRRNRSVLSIIANSKLAFHYDKYLSVIRASALYAYTKIFSNI